MVSRDAACMMAEGSLLLLLLLWRTSMEDSFNRDIRRMNTIAVGTMFLLALIYVLVSLHQSTGGWSGVCRSSG